MRHHTFPIIAVLLTANIALADPCGMVPPIYLGSGTPIARVGDQNTFVFYTTSCRFGYTAAAPPRQR